MKTIRDLRRVLLPPPLIDLFQHSRTVRFPLALSLGAFALTAAGEAIAGDFTPEGAYLFDPAAAVTLDFEAPGPAGTPDPVDDEGALHGKKVLRLGQSEVAYFDVSLPAEQRTYRATAWIREHEASVFLAFSYSDRTDDVAVLYPTGRVTSDGWVEVAHEHIRVDGPRVKRATLGAFTLTGAVLDAFEIVADGDASAFPAVPSAACSGLSSGACAADQVCVFNECRNAAGWVPPIPDERDGVADYLGSRMKLLFGPFHERTHDLPSSLVAVEQMKSAEDPWTYWNSFALAVRKLHDGHTSTSMFPDFIQHDRRQITACFIEGDADLTHAAAPKDPEYLDVLVSHVDPANTLGLRPGDRLVKIDGKHPIAWARSLVEVHWTLPSVSNPRTFAELASSLHRLIDRYASTVEIIRCDAASGACGAPETVSIADIPFDPPGAQVSTVTCDNRPVRHLPDAPADHGNYAPSGVYSGLVIESNEAEKIYGMEWESLLTSNGTDGVGAALKAAVNTWKTEPARGVILDHRTGYGGSRAAAQILWDYAVPRRPNDHYDDRQRGEDEQPSAAAGKAIFDLAADDGFDVFAGTDNPVTDVPVALLVTLDASASDWLALGMKGAPNVRLFGPFETNGAFSTRYVSSYWLGMIYSLATGDTFLPDGSTANGTGVSPDVIVMPKQSDLLAGKDTVYEAALAWVRSEMVP